MGKRAFLGQNQGTPKKVLAQKRTFFYPYFSVFQLKNMVNDSIGPVLLLIKRAIQKNTIASLQEQPAPSNGRIATS